MVRHLSFIFIIYNILNSQLLTLDVFFLQSTDRISTQNYIQITHLQHRKNLHQERILANQMRLIGYDQGIHDAKMHLHDYRKEFLADLPLAIVYLAYGEKDHRFKDSKAYSLIEKISTQPDTIQMRLIKHFVKAYCKGYHNGASTFKHKKKYQSANS